jgi:hypothetical protein
MPAALTPKCRRMFYLLAALCYVGVAQSSSQTPADIFSVPVVNPNVISAGGPAVVTVSVRISGAPARVWLERLSSPNAARGTVIANLRGGDGLYSGQVQFNESSAGTIFLQVAATFSAAGIAMSANVQPPRSRIFTVRVLPRQGGQASSGGGLSTGEKIGIGVGIAAGAAAAAEWWKNHQQHSGDAQGGQSLQRSGLKLRYPPDWQLNAAVPEEGPISLNNFKSQYSERGGIMPPGGAEIDISYLPGASGSMKQIMTADLEDSEEQTIDQPRFQVGGVKATRASYTDTFAPGLVYRTVVVYVPRGGGLYKFFLTYHKGDPWEAPFVADFEQILKSVHFTQ